MARTLAEKRAWLELCLNLFPVIASYKLPYLDVADFMQRIWLLARDSTLANLWASRRDERVADTNVSHMTTQWTSIRVKHKRDRLRDRHCLDRPHFQKYLGLPLETASTDTSAAP